MTDSEPQPVPPTTSVLTALGRGLLLRCPRCGAGDLFASWVKPREACENCGLKLDRGEGDYFLGAYMVNLLVAEIVPALTLVIGIVVTWPEVPWRLLGGIVVGLAVALPFLFFPFSRTLWLALDSTFRRS
ncbi:MAG: DUF983 domain-containing protein [Gemmatimonadota bacterium]